MDKLNMETPNLISENGNKLLEFVKSVFPSCVKEWKDNDWNVQEKIDFDLLRAEIWNISVWWSDERYRLDWPWKMRSIFKANTPITKTLRPVKEDSVDWDNTWNVYIEWDNFEVLKILQEAYLWKVKMIYIDPPYNTGNDFVYNDDFSESDEEYKAKTEKNEEWYIMVKNTESNWRFHSDWLSMMYERLKIARDLLTDDGIIFISIDDNEVDNLKKICDEIFWENNFVADLVWKKKAWWANDSTDVAVEHEYIVCYRKNLNWFFKIPLWEDRIKEYKYSDEKEEINWKYTIKNLNDKSLQDSKWLHFDIECPDWSILYWKDNQWKCNEATFRERLKDNRIVFIQKKDGTWTCNYKIYLNEEKWQLKYDEMGNVIKRWRNISSIIDNVLNRDWNDEIKDLFWCYPFSYPKPTKLIKQLLQCATTKDSLILDFFSWSASTAHACFLQNIEDWWNRKFIMVQLPEICDEKSEAYENWYKTITEIWKERIRRAAKKIKEETNADIDYGFRVYRVDESCMKDVYYHPNDTKQENLWLFTSNIKEDRSSEDLLTQVILNLWLTLDLPIEEKRIKNNKVFYVAWNSLVACFDENIDFDIIEEIAKDQPLKMVLRDSSFRNDADRINFENTMKELSKDTIIRVI